MFYTYKTRSYVSKNAYHDVTGTTTWLQKGLFEKARNSIFMFLWCESLKIYLSEKNPTLQLESRGVTRNFDRWVLKSINTHKRYSNCRFCNNFGYQQFLVFGQNPWVLMSAKAPVAPVLTMPLAWKDQWNSSAVLHTSQRGYIHLIYGSATYLRCI